jgi:hypothetical protein
VAGIVLFAITWPDREASGHVHDELEPRGAEPHI